MPEENMRLIIGLFGAVIFGGNLLFKKANGLFS